MGKSGSRRCVFCGGTPVSSEHVLPKWLRNTPAGAAAFARGAGQTLPPHYIGGFVVNPGPSGRLDVSWQGYERGVRIPGLQIEVKAPCKPCNNGWMSKLELEAQQVLSPLITDAGPQLIPAEDSAVLRRWALKTAAMFEFNHPPSRSFSQDVLDAIARGEEPPGSWSVGMLRNSDEPELFSLGHNGGPIHGPSPLARARVEVGRGSITLIAVGEVIFCVRYGNGYLGPKILSLTDFEPAPIELAGAVSWPPAEMDAAGWGRAMAVTPLAAM